MKDLNEFDQYIYRVRDVDFNFSNKVATMLIGYFGRKIAFKTFCKKVGINPKTYKKSKTAMPTTYLVEHNRIDYLGRLRDRIIVAIRARYDAQNDKLEIRRSQLEAEKKATDQAIRDEKSRLSNDETSLKKEAETFNKISLKASISYRESRIKNMESEANRLMEKINEAIKIRNKNSETWASQINLIDKTLNVAITGFCNNYGMQIKRRLGYDKFNFYIPKYDENIKKIIKG